jgi:hypothetical protein
LFRDPHDLSKKGARVLEVLDRIHGHNQDADRVGE